ncbi:aspartate aminotransferase family protein, partial [Bacteroidota bacterium]
FEELQKITKKTACVIAEVIQAEAGIILPEKGFIEGLRKKCSETGTLLIFDEIQTGFGRTGSLFAFEHYKVIPDILTIAKAMGGGLPLGAFVSSKKIMNVLSHKPPLGHITTFGGHPVSCAAGLASLQILLEKDYIKEAEQKGILFRKYLKHKAIKSIRGKGLFIAVELIKPEYVGSLLKNCLILGTVFDPFLFCKNAFRIAPPLIINKEQIKEACDILLSALDKSV